MKKLTFLALFILTLVYATQAHSVVAVHDELVENEEVKFEFITQKLQEPIVTMPDGYNNEYEDGKKEAVVYFHKPAYCGLKSFTEEQDHYKLTMKLCEEE